MFVDAIVPILCDMSYSLLTLIPIVGPGRRPTMVSHPATKEAIMPSNRDNKGKGTKGSNYDDLSGAGKTGTTGNQQNSDLASGPGDNAQRGDWGSRQSGGLDQGNQAQSDLGSGPGDNSRRGSQNRNRQSADLDRSRQGDNL
jgi:hypothetical protein